MDTIMYAIITHAKPEIPHSAMNIIKRVISSNCLSFPLKAIFFILRENIGISEIISQEKRKINIIVRNKIGLLSGAILCIL